MQIHHILDTCTQGMDIEAQSLNPCLEACKPGH
jgi:hypothetical protein